MPNAHALRYTSAPCARNSSATVVATPTLRCLAWPADDWRQRLKRQQDLRTIVHAAIGRDLAAKTAAHNLTLAQI